MPGIPNSLTGHSANLMARAGRTCTTQICKDAASAILQDLDLNVDPCDDFYQYTCGGWIKDHHIPNSEPAVGTFNNLRNDNLDGLRQLLEGSYDDLLNGVRSNGKSDPLFINESQIDKDRSNFNKIKTYYESCMDENSIEVLGPTPVYSEITSLLDKLGYTTDMVDTRFSTDNLREFTQTLIHLGDGDMDHLFSLGIGPDDHNPEENSININQPSLGLPSREYYERSEALVAYRTGLISILNAIFGEPKDTAPLDEIRRVKLAENKLMMLGEVDIESMVDRFIDFETRLAKITLPNDQLQNPVELYNPMSIPELHQNYPVVDWIQLLRHFTPNDVSLPQKVIVTSPKFMKELSNWLSDSPNRDDGVTTQTLREFFIIKTIMAKIGSLDRHTRELYRDMQSKISSGTTEPLPRSRVCVSQTSNIFGQLLGRYFVMKNFGGELQRQQVAQFIDNIQSSWNTRLQDISWLDGETRLRAVEKVGKIKHKEAYSIVTPDDRSPDTLAEYYGEINVDPRDFFANQKSALLWGLKKEWNKVGAKVNLDEWYMNPHEVNAYYTPTFNEIVLPAGILQSPFYHPELPQYLNYGGIGVVIGHEITHAFDNSGRLYDGDGKLNTWWTDATTNSFNDRSQCFINQYGKFSVNGPNNSSHSVNGKMTLGENLADNGGINAALLSMRKSIEENPNDNLSLPGLESLSPEQLFFVNFGRVWCSNMRPEMVAQRVLTDVHSPPRVRVNAAVQNSPEFANAFKCGAPGSREMHPVDKCSIW